MKEPRQKISACSSEAAGVGDSLEAAAKVKNLQDFLPIIAHSTKVG